MRGAGVLEVTTGVRTQQLLLCAIVRLQVVTMLLPREVRHARDPLDLTGP